MSEQSQKDEMNAAIRAQRERHNVPRSIAPDPPPAAPPAPEPAPEAEPEKPKSFFARLRRK
jgi:hypothetical protein